MQMAILRLIEFVLQLVIGSQCQDKIAIMCVWKHSRAMHVRGKLKIEAEKSANIRRARICQLQALDAFPSIWCPGSKHLSMVTASVMANSGKS